MSEAKWRWVFVMLLCGAAWSLHSKGWSCLLTMQEEVVEAGIMGLLWVVQRLAGLLVM
jgi:hypothetical protein